MTDLPQKLQRFLDAFAMLETRSERIQFLIDVSDRFREVPPDVAERPFPRNQLAPHCESEAYVHARRVVFDGMVDEIMYTCEVNDSVKALPHLLLG